jgi:hypothetical protein
MAEFTMKSGFWGRFYYEMAEIYQENGRIYYKMAENYYENGLFTYKMVKNDEKWP